MTDEIEVLCCRLADALTSAGQSLATAESCTGGWIAKSLTDVAGSSAWFGYGFICYSNQAKQTMIGVDPDLIEAQGAVSREVAEAMALGARATAGADWALAVTGIAGPDGGTPDKPVGMVCIAWAGATDKVSSEVHRFTGNRAAVRRASVVTALQGALARLVQHSG